MTDKTVITMPSITAAIKAQRFLRAKGASCEIQRAAKVSKAGCTHVIIVNSNAKSTVRMLKENGLKYGIVIQEANE